MNTNIDTIKIYPNIFKCISNDILTRFITNKLTIEYLCNFNIVKTNSIEVCYSPFLTQYYKLFQIDPNRHFDLNTFLSSINYDMSHYAPIDHLVCPVCKSKLYQVSENLNTSIDISVNIEKLLHNTPEPYNTKNYVYCVNVECPLCYNIQDNLFCKLNILNKYNSTLTQYLPTISDIYFNLQIVHSFTEYPKLHLLELFKTLHFLLKDYFTNKSLFKATHTNIDLNIINQYVINFINMTLKDFLEICGLPIIFREDHEQLSEEIKLKDVIDDKGNFIGIAYILGQYSIAFKQYVLFVMSTNQEFLKDYYKFVKLNWF